MALSLILIITTGPISTLASQETNQFAHEMLKSSLVQYANDNPNAGKYAGSSVKIGVSKRILTPEKGGSGRLLYVILLFATAIISLVGLLLAVLPEKLAVQRAVAVIIFVQAVTLLAGSLIAALVWPTDLPYDATPIVNHWMDRTYVEEPEWVNETRLAGNWFVKLEEQAQPVTDLDGFETSFCTVFKQLIPNTGAEVVENPPSNASVTLTERTVSVMRAIDNDDDFRTGLHNTTEFMSTVANSPAAAEENPSTNETFTMDVTIADALALSTSSSTMGSEKERTEYIPVERASKDNVNEFFMTYLVGRPSGIDDAFRVLSYLALSAMACAPAAVGQLCRLWILMPLVLVWAALWLSFMILGTPSVLRVLAAPIESVQEFVVCDIKYRVLVVDKMTRLVAGLDAAFFSIVLLVGLINGFRWLRFAETKLRKKEENEVKLVNYEEVRSGSGTLRW